MNYIDWPFRTPGIPDEFFTRGKIPMTKMEARVIALAQARIFEEAVIYDIGAGTGSFSIEAALSAPKGRVFAIEKEDEGVELIKNNAEKFGVKNIEVICGVAPGDLQGLPRPDRVFVGGSGGNLKEILESVHRALRPGGRIVSNAIVLENIAALKGFLIEKDYMDLQIIQVSVARGEGMGGKSMFKANNPVWIISGTKAED